MMSLIAMSEGRPHWTVDRLYELVRDWGGTLEALTGHSGLGHATIIRWRRPHCSPRIGNLEAALNSLGYELKIVKMAPEDHAKATAWYARRQQKREAP